MLGVLGKGGFGTVYHARLEGADGFVKEVAIKLLTAQDPSPEMLSRFRDEARILGMVRDRAIVNVDPPTRLEGRWAVVMEYVDGVDCRRLLKAHGPLPPLVALAIVEEVARTLDVLWHHPGMDGKPIQLLHRDLKPSNIQVTPGGAVKLLDFGVARADIEQRETRTANDVAGTMAYMAPERLDRIDEPPGDIFSLGVVLEELLTGRRPSLLDRGPPPQDAALQLARQMRSLDPRSRPTAADVERACRQLIERGRGTSLRDWARKSVPHRPTTRRDDPLVGTTLSETFAHFTMSAPLPPPRGRRREVVTGVALAAMIGLAVSLGLGMVTGGAVGLWYWWAQAREVAVEAPLERVPEAPRTEPVAPVDVAPVDVAPVDVAEPVAQPVARPAVARPPVDRPPVKPTPTDRAPEAPEAAHGRVSQSGADTVELVGEAGRFGVGVVPAGTYAVSARFGDDTVPAGEIEITAGERVSLRCDDRFKRCRKE
ncbi:MAG: protein kinase [Myxococcota bacterium]